MKTIFQLSILGFDFIIQRKFKDHKAYTRAWMKKNRQHVYAYYRWRYANNIAGTKEKTLKRNFLWQKNNPDKVKIIQKRYRLKHA